MNMQEYLDEVMRTVAGETFPDICLPSTIVEAMAIFQAGGACMDAVKKGFYYGKATPKMDEIQRLVPFDHFTFDDVIDLNSLHGIIGIGSEASELAQLIEDSILSKEPVSRDDILDEAGDLMWYLGLLLRSIGTTFEEVAAKNIAKLRARFPEKFTLDDWESRDKAAELAAQQSVH